MPFVIAAGVLADRDGSPWSELISPLADIAGGVTKAEQHKERIIASLEKLLPTSKETHELTEDISALPYEYWWVRDRAAYMLGLAVGQQLGPHAFTNGDPK